jgi:hypothetical protein
MFANNEMGSWQEIFSMVALPGAETIIADTDSLSNVRVYQNSANLLLQRIRLGN